MIEMKKPDDLPELMELTEVARVFNVSAASLRHNVNRGKLKKFQRGADNRVFIRPAEVEELYRIRPVDGGEE